MRTTNPEPDQGHPRPPPPEMKLGAPLRQIFQNTDGFKNVIHNVYRHNLP